MIIDTGNGEYLGDEMIGDYNDAKDDDKNDWQRWWLLQIWLQWLG